IMRKLFREGDETLKRRSIDFHRPGFFRQDDAVFVIIDVWRILEIPVFTQQVDLNNAVVSSCWVSSSSGIAFVLGTDVTWRVAEVFCHFPFALDLFWLFFRLG